MKTGDKIGVMQAYLEGKAIEFCTYGTWKLWNCSSEPNWNWESNNYRVKVKPVQGSFNFRVEAVSEELMGWKEAKKWAESKGLRLPSRVESLLILSHAKDLNLTLPEFWWSDEQLDSNSAWFVSSKGCVYSGYGCNRYRVCAISDN